MSESNQEGYQTLGWIINKSERGLFLVVADEAMQKEILQVYRKGMVGIYDYRKNPGAYSFQKLQESLEALPEVQTFFVANFQFAVQGEEDLKRLNFSRDMLARLEKNIIFLTTPYGDDMLAVGAYDFYSFIKIRIIFPGYGIEKQRMGSGWISEEASQDEDIWGAEEARQKMKETYTLMEQAEVAENAGRYDESAELLLRVKKIREKLLGEDHLEMAEVYDRLAGMYRRQGMYSEAEKLYKKALNIQERVLGKNHSDTAASYNNLGLLYNDLGKYQEAEELYRKSLAIEEKVSGEGHPNTATSYNNLAILYQNQGKYEESEKLYKKAILVREKALGKGHPDTAASYSNLAALYEEQGNCEGKH